MAACCIYEGTLGILRSRLLEWNKPPGVVLVWSAEPGSRILFLIGRYFTTFIC